MVLAYKTHKNNFALFDDEGKNFKSTRRLKWFMERYWRVIVKVKENLKFGKKPN